jgi:hypothetical protein
MRTTLTIEDDIAIRIERIREERGDSLKAVVNEALRRLGRCKVPNLDKTSAVLAFAEGEDYR